MIRSSSAVPRLTFCILLAVLASSSWPRAQEPAPRRRVGIAFGGGSARGFAHVGVIRWFEEHQIPIDVAAGTSMGGLIGGSFATGMSSQELERLLTETDWNQMFGASSYRFKSFRRKEDARAYPSRLDFGLKHGFGFPSSLNNGQQVDLLLTRLTLPYSDIQTFAELPTPFRCVAVDLKTASQVVLDHGSLARAMRATMSLPGIFPPVEIEDKVLVDGGAMNNVPADVVRAMGADVVIAVNVGSMSDVRQVSSSMLGLMGNTVDAMMLASTRKGMAGADIVINPALDKFGSLDWRRALQLIEAGYQAAESMKEKLLPLALDGAAWKQFVDARQARRRTTIPQPATLTVRGASPNDERRIRRLLEPRLKEPIDPLVIAHDVESLSGLDAYETLTWDIVEDQGRHALVIDARPKAYAPPFLMFSTNLQNTTSDDFSFQVASRYLAYDLLIPGTETRLDVGIGSSPHVGAEFLKRLGASPLFVAVGGAAGRQRFNFVSENVVVAQYDQKVALGQFQVGVDFGRDSEARVGVRSGHVEAILQVGDPSLPSVDGTQTEIDASWKYDGQDSVVIPSSGTRATATMRHVSEAPTVSGVSTDRTNQDLTQAEVVTSTFWNIHRRRDRLFLSAGFGSSFDGQPLPTDQFSLGFPMRLSAFDVGERRGDHYGALTAGYLYGVGRLPDFIGGPIFAGTWLENGSAFDDFSDAQLSTQVGLGLVVETLLGPAMAGMSFGFDGRSRFFIGVGRVLP